MKRTIVSLLTLGALAVACGSPSDNDSAPPTNPDDATDDLFALQAGTYVIDRLWDLQDGCGREPLHPQDPITAVESELENDGQGKISIDRCLFDGRQLGGDVIENRGTLSVRHANRQDSFGEYVAQYDQECRFEVTVTANNTIEGLFTEYQRNRNDIMREATQVSAESCATSYKVVMTKR